MNRVLAFMLALATGTSAAGCYTDAETVPQSATIGAATNATTTTGASTSASTKTASAQAPERVWVPCRYPQGWDSTDAGASVSGTPVGYGHQCLVEYQPSDGSVSVPCNNSGNAKSAEDFYGLPMRAQYDCNNPSH